MSYIAEILWKEENLIQDVDNDIVRHDNQNDHRVYDLGKEKIYEPPKRRIKEEKQS
jgi:hypothetical protein